MPIAYTSIRAVKMARFVMFSHIITTVFFPSK